MHRLADLALLDDHAAGLDHEPRQLEHRLLVLVRRVDRDVGIGAGAEMPLVLEAQNLGRAAAGDDADLVERVLALQVATASSARGPAAGSVLSTSRR